ncbi:MAG: amino acid ABC transporter permease [Lachnospiraceae bacterium]
MINFHYFFNSLRAAISYIPQNLYICVLTVFICMILGTLIAMLRVYKVPFFKPVMDILMALLKAFPANLVLLIVFLLFTNNFNKLSAFFKLNISIQEVNNLYIAIIALIICSLSGISEVIRSGLLSIDKGQYEAGYSVGMTRAHTFLRIILPQAVKAVIPPLTNSVLSVMKTTALVSVIGVVDIMNGALIAANYAYSYLEAYLAAALVFWVIGLILESLSQFAEKRLR